MMKVIQIDKFGDIETLKVSEWETPNPKVGEVRIRVDAAAINPVDYKVRQGRFGGDLPMVLGQDLAGVVDKIGEGVNDFHVGDEVCAYLGGSKSNGAYAEYVCVPVSFICRKPSRLSFIQGAAIPLVGLTAYESVVGKANVRAGEAVFIAGGTGGAGSMAIQLCRYLGAEPIITTAGSDGGVNYLVEELGVSPECIIRYRGRSRSQLQTQVQSCNDNQPINVAFDFVGGEMKQLCCRVIGFGGRVVSIVEEPDDFKLDLFNGRESPMFARSATFHFEFLAAKALFGESKDWVIYRQQLEDLMQLIETGQIQAIATTEIGSFSEESFRQAHAMLEQGSVRGKLVVSRSLP